MYISIRCGYRFTIHKKLSTAGISKRSTTFICILCEFYASKIELLKSYAGWLENGQREVRVLNFYNLYKSVIMMSCELLCHLLLQRAEAKFFHLDLSQGARTIRQPSHQHRRSASLDRWGREGEGKGAFGLLHFLYPFSLPFQRLLTHLTFSVKRGLSKSISSALFRSLNLLEVRLCW